VHRCRCRTNKKLNRDDVFSLSTLYFDRTSLQFTTTHCNTLQHTTTHCNTPTIQHTASHGCRCRTKQMNRVVIFSLATLSFDCNSLATHCNTLQHAATHWQYNTLTMQHIVTHGCRCRTKKMNRDVIFLLATLYFDRDDPQVFQCVAVCCSVLQCVAVCCSVLQCVAAAPKSSIVM